MPSDTNLHTGRGNGVSSFCIGGALFGGGGGIIPPTAAVEPTDSESILVVTDEGIYSSHTADTMTSRVPPVIRSKTDNSEIAELPLPNPSNPRGNYSQLEVFELSLCYGKAAVITAIDRAKKGDGSNCYQKRNSKG